MLLSTTAQLFLPIRQLRIDRSEGHKQAPSPAAALVSEIPVHRGKVFVQQPVETTGPGLRHTVAAEFGNERNGVIEAETAQRPARQVDVDVDQLCGRRARNRCRVGVNERSSSAHCQSSLEELATVEKADEAIVNHPSTPFSRR